MPTMPLRVPRVPRGPLSAVPVSLVLALLVLAALGGPAGAEQQAPPPVPDALVRTAAELTKTMANVESLTDYGAGLTSFYKKSYVFEVDSAALGVGEAYLGRNTDDKGVNMEWSGRYVYRVPPEATVGPADPANELFRITCPGKAKCIEYKSINEVTWSRGLPAPKPRNTGGIIPEITVNVGKDKALMDRARNDVSALLQGLRELR
ncbi:MAG: hypothetical protein H0S85_02560 [Desulfovibrionaceae bacterium]|jgi:hypothetical protein|nr:hypothetical protein [Desulfovibrionaceae bacterium]